MTKEQIEETAIRMSECAYGLAQVGTDYQVFFDGYLELLKEQIAMSSEEDFPKLRLKRDVILEIMSQVRDYSKAFEEKIKKDNEGVEENGEKKGY